MDAAIPDSSDRSDHHKENAHGWSTLMRPPLVSVVMGTYNHAPFVAEAISSVLTQDFTDFEFLISDDGSSDGTARVVAAQTDPRLHFTPNAKNRGAALVLADLIGKAQGRYIAVINSDDAWLQGKLSEQVAFLEKNPDVGAVFGRVRFFDRDGQVIPKDALSFGEAFEKANRSRGEWLRYFFFHGNCLCHPTVLIRRELYKTAGLYDNRLRQLPDLDMWIRLAKHADIFISNSNMINFRILPGENTSCDTSTNRIRTLNEHFFVGLDFFTGVSADLLRQGFGDLLRHQEMPTERHVTIESALLFLHPVLSLTSVYQIIALLKLRALLADHMCRDILKTDYQFDDLALHRLAAEAGGLQASTDCAPRHSWSVSDVRTAELGQIILRRLATKLRMLTRNA
jgi:glycosyltransferase involved in cell wall biosynthesis